MRINLSMHCEGPEQSMEDAIIVANEFMQERLQEVQKLKSEGKKDEALKLVGEAIHTAQDSISPAHRGFQEFDADAGWKKHLDHAKKELDYPEEEEREQLEAVTRKVYDIYA